VDTAKQEELTNKFLRLTEANQQYILGLVEGIRYARTGEQETPDVEAFRQDPAGSESN
jgi:hypothetical protein